MDLKDLYILSYLPQDFLFQEINKAFKTYSKHSVQFTHFSVMATILNMMFIYPIHLFILQL